MKPLQSRRCAATSLCPSIGATMHWWPANTSPFCELHKFAAEFYCSPLGSNGQSRRDGQHRQLSIRLQSLALHTACLCWWWWGLIWWGTHLGAGQNVVTSWCSSTSSKERSSPLMNIRQGNTTKLYKAIQTRTNTQRRLTPSAVWTMRSIAGHCLPTLVSFLRWAIISMKDRILPRWLPFRTFVHTELLLLLFINWRCHA